MRALIDELEALRERYGLGPGEHGSELDPALRRQYLREFANIVRRHDASLFRTLKEHLQVGDT